MNAESNSWRETRTLCLIWLLALTPPLANTVYSAETDAKPISTRALDLLQGLEKSETFQSFLPPQEDARRRIKEELAKWKDGQINSAFVAEGYGVGFTPNIEALRKALGNPDKETTEELRLEKAIRKRVPADDAPKGIQLIDANPFLMFEFKEGNKVSFVLADKDDKGEKQYVYLFDPKTGEVRSGTNALSGKVLWYGPVGFGFLKTGYGGERLTVLMTAPGADRPTATSARTSKTTPPEMKETNWPKYSTELEGRMEVRVKNPNDFKVKVGLRSDGSGKDFTVAPNDTQSVKVPNGRYDIYFQYSTDPDGLYQGDSFTLNNNGVEIQIVKVVNGNYGIKKVK